MKKIEADVIIVGGGSAGLAAAVMAAEGGASVIVLEKGATTGGQGNGAFGPFAVESRLQRMRQFSLTREEAFKIHMDYTHWRADARLVKTFIDKSADTIEWLEKLGVEFLGVECHNRGFYFTWHIVKGQGANIMKTLTEKAKDLGIQIYLRTSVGKLLKEGDRIIGVKAEDNFGEEIHGNAKAVIIATGGFGDNPDWIKKYTGYEWGRDMFSLRIPGLVGDGIRMAWEAGAASTEIIMHLVPPCIPGIEELSAVTLTFYQPGLIVNLLGERFINEEIMSSPTFLENAMSMQKNRSAVIIFDEATKRHYEDVDLDFPLNEELGMTNIQDLDKELNKLIDQGNKNIFIVDSLEELAIKCGINPENLEKTIYEYNKACETGRDDLFHKNARYLRPIKQPKFYAAKLFLSGLGNLGGIKINYKTEVLTKDYDVIPGLYAAGTDSNSIYGDSYIFALPGNTLGFALNSGRIAGENAAEYVKSIKDNPIP